jgi:serine/threonine protein kinase
MRRIPAGFELSLPQRDGSAKHRPAGFQYLLNPDDYLARISVPIDNRKRLLLLADLAATLAEFHRLGIVVGDLSPNNVLFDLDADQPRSFFIDCDAMRLSGASVLPQVETSDWEVPAGEELATPASDAYKLGLMAIRLFARDQSQCDPTVLGTISGQLAGLARRSLSPDPAARPAPAEWVPVLRDAAGSTSQLIGAPALPTPPDPTPPVPPTSSPPSALAVVVVLVVLVICLIGFIASVT